MFFFEHLLSKWWVVLQLSITHSNKSLECGCNKPSFIPYFSLRGWFMNKTIMCINILKIKIIKSVIPQVQLQYYTSHAAIGSFVKYIFWFSFTKIHIFSVQVSCIVSAGTWQCCTSVLLFLQLSDPLKGSLYYSVTCTSCKSMFAWFPLPARHMTLNPVLWQPIPTVNTVYFDRQLNPACSQKHCDAGGSTARRFWWLSEELSALFIPRSLGVQGISLPPETLLALTHSPRFLGLIHLCY